MLEFLKGKKTFILSGLAFVLVALHGFGIVSDSLFQLGLGLLGSGAVASLRAALNSLPK